MLIEVDISRKEQVLPMVPAGKSNHEMLGCSSMRRMLTAKLQNRSGVLNRFTGVLSRRQVNIESISVGATEDRMYRVSLLLLMLLLMMKWSKSSNSSIVRLM